MEIVAVDNDRWHQAHNQRRILGHSDDLGRQTHKSSPDPLMQRGQTKHQHDGGDADTDQHHEAAFGRQFVKPEADKKVPELIGGLLKDHAEVKGHTQGGYYCNAVWCAGNEGK